MISNVSDLLSVSASALRDMPWARARWHRSPGNGWPNLEAGRSKMISRCSDGHIGALHTDGETRPSSTPNGHPGRSVEMLRQCCAQVRLRTPSDGSECGRRRGTPGAAAAPAPRGPHPVQAASAWSLDSARGGNLRDHALRGLGALDRLGGSGHMGLIVQLW